jgi:parallel beta-helix repeat protein
MKRKGLAVGIILLFIGTCVIPITAQKIEKLFSPISGGNWLYVGGSGPGNYSKIQDAIDKAFNDDTVFVYDDSSPYFEHVSINKSMNLIGENKETTIIVGSNVNAVILVNAPYVSISNFSIIGSTYSSGIQVKSECVIINNNNILSENDMGISLEYADWATISNNSIQSSFAGIYVWFSNKAIISRNFVSGSRDGISIIVSKNDIIMRNNLTNNQYGIDLTEVKYTIIRENNFIKNTASNIDFNERSFRCLWQRNYWGEPLTSPKIFPGTFTIHIPIAFLIEITIPIPYIKVDWHPAQEPYDFGS